MKICKIIMLLMHFRFTMTSYRHVGLCWGCYICMLGFEVNEGKLEYVSESHKSLFAHV